MRLSIDSIQYGKSLGNSNFNVTSLYSIRTESSDPIIQILYYFRKPTTEPNYNHPKIQRKIQVIQPTNRFRHYCQKIISKIYLQAFVCADQNLIARQQMNLWHGGDTARASRIGIVQSTRESVKRRAFKFALFNLYFTFNLSYVLEILWQQDIWIDFCIKLVNWNFNFI